MRSSIVFIGMFAASLAFAATDDYTEIRNLSLDAADIDSLTIEAGAGSMVISGDPELNEIMVKATIEVPDRDEDKARKIVESDLVLKLEPTRNGAELRAYFDYSGWGDSPLVHIEVDVPSTMSLSVDDGSGSIVVNGVNGDIRVDDGSGSIKMSAVGGNVSIDDGSGSINIQQVGEDLAINDGSGSIKVETVGGSVTLDDGSGSINVSDVEHDVIIVDDGSGSLNMSNIRGQVENDQ